MKYRLNEDQLSAVLSDDKKLLCLAGAGTGKTTTMLARISHLVEQDVDPHSILVLTFTNAAAFEMKDRYMRDHSASPTPEFRTFHSFCYHILATDNLVRTSLGYSTVPSIADDNERKRIQKESQNITGIKTSIESLQKKKIKSKDDIFNLNILTKASRRLMKKQNLITFDDLCTRICTLFQEDSSLIQKYKEKYHYIFVDEFQDTDSVQYEFVKSFSNSSLFVVGDALQAIYAFRGADSSIIKELSMSPEWTTVKLYKNYRSTSTICEFANRHSTHADETYRIDIQSGKDIEGDPVVCKSMTAIQGYARFNIDLLSFCSQDALKQSGTTAILCRTNREVESIKYFFDKSNIEYKTRKDQDDIIHVLKSVKSNNYFISWLASYLNSEQYASYLRLSALKNNYNLKDFLQDFGHLESIDIRWRLPYLLRQICKQTSSTILERCKKILELIRYRGLNLDEFTCTSMTSAIDYILDQYENKEKADANIYIGTIHSVKGLEFDNVYVLGVNSEAFKLDNEENLNLYYVAITRAKSHLVVFERG